MLGGILQTGDTELGYMTTITILNDGFSDIERNPEDFVRGIGKAMHDGGGFGVGSHANCVEVMRSDHADIFRLYATQYNSVIELSPYSQDTLAVAERLPHVVRQLIDQARHSLDLLENKINDLQS